MKVQAELGADEELTALRSCSRLPSSKSSSLAHADGLQSGVVVVMRFLCAEGIPNSSATRGSLLVALPGKTTSL